MWPRSAPHAAAPSGPACPPDFQQTWHSFVHTFVDVLHAGGPAAPRAPQPAPAAALPPLVLPAVPRLIAVGDLHGDLTKARRAFRLAGLINDKDGWTGGTTTVVQVGDLLDRGDAELALLFWMERLRRQAAAAGGALHVLNGNHETMNVAGQYRYVTRGAMHSFRDWLHRHTMETALKAHCGCTASAAGLHTLLREQREAEHGGGQPHTFPPNAAAAARTAALRPGGEVTKRFFAPNPVVLQVGSTLFAHGGVLTRHVDYGLERINKEAQEWMLTGQADSKPKFLSGRNAVVWSRHYSAHDGARCDCDQLKAVLARLPGAQRMVVGHTIQEGGITSACEGRVLRIDVGLSRGCGDGSPEVLEILDDTVVRRLSEAQQENVAPQQAQQAKQAAGEHAVKQQEAAGKTWAAADSGQQEQQKGQQEQRTQVAVLGGVAAAEAARPAALQGRQQSAGGA